MDSLSYETAKELKEAGFPTFSSPSKAKMNGLWDYYEELREKGKESKINMRRYERVVLPTLSELIEECGDKFEMLYRNVDDNGKTIKWCCAHIDLARDEGVFCGKTPSEAVSRLWMKINKK